MDEKDLVRTLRALEEAPTSPEAWLALARNLARAQPAEVVLGRDQLTAFLEAWAAAPELRDLEVVFRILTGLTPAPGAEVPAGWLAEHRVDPAEGAPYHGDLGLPLAVTRDEGGRVLALVPAGPLTMPCAGTATAYQVATGYLVRELVEEIRPDRTVDEPGHGRALGRLGEAVVQDPGTSRGPLPTCRLLGRRMGHGLTPEDLDPLPPPLAPPGPQGIGPPRLGGAPPPPRPAGAVPLPRGFEEMVPDPVPEPPPEPAGTDAEAPDEPDATAPRDDLGDG